MLKEGMYYNKKNGYHMDIQYNKEASCNKWYICLYFYNGIIEGIQIVEQKYFRTQKEALEYKRSLKGYRIVKN
ncbi:MAG: hypothetical protein ACRC92_21540 [Peptostreptococcaceae bacterium]